MIIIGLAGKMGCGKDYIATNHIIPIIKELGLSYIIMSFADQIKVNIMSHYNIPFEQLYCQKTDKTRQLLQIEGTERGRKVHGEDIWVRYFDNWLKVYESRGIQVVVVSDVRFKNEMDYIMSKGGIVIKVTSPERTTTRLYQESKCNPYILKKLTEHQSECDLDSYPESAFTYTINNDPGMFIDTVTLQTIVTRAINFQ